MGFSYLQLQSLGLTDLIAAAQADDKDDSPAIDEIIRRFDDKSRRIAQAVCLRVADREDVANAARLALVRAVRRHRTDEVGFTAYAVTFMTGAARRESERLALPRETFVPGPDLVLLADHLPPALHLANNGPDYEGWGTGLIAKIIASLPPRQRTLLTERYIQDLDLARIAYEHGCSVSAVSQRLGTVHRRIRDMMSSATTATA
jgi:DNA-directed RNA polymerase specialized sigma24 family protein